MADRRFWWAAAAYIVPTFPLGYFWHLEIFGAAYARLEMFRAEVIIPFGLAAMALQAVIYAGLYPRLFGTARHEWRESAWRFGALFGALGWSFMVLPVAAKYRMSSVPDFLLLETGFTVLQYLVVSPLIALAWRDRT